MSEIEALRALLADYWRGDHDERCDNTHWPHEGLCHAPPPALLAGLDLSYDIRPGCDTEDAGAVVDPAPPLGVQWNR